MSELQQQHFGVDDMQPFEIGPPERPSIPSNPWGNEHSLAAGVNKLVDEQTDTTTNEKRSTTTTLQLELAKRQKPDDYIPDKRLVAFNNGIIPSSSSVAPFKNSGGRPDWVSQNGWLGASALPPLDPDYKLLDWDKAQQYKSVKDRLHTLVKLSVGISDDMINKVPPLRSDKEYTNQDTATDAFLLLMARMSLDDIPPEQRKEEARRLLGVVSNLVEDCDINAFFRGVGGGGGGGDLVVPSAALSTGGINSTSDEELTESNTPTDGTNAAVPSSCTTSDAVIDNKVDLVLSVASCPEGNNSSTDDELVLASNSELRATEEISSMDEGTSTASSVVEEAVSIQEEIAAALVAVLPELPATAEVISSSPNSGYTLEVIRSSKSPRHTKLNGISIADRIKRMKSLPRNINLCSSMKRVMSETKRTKVEQVSLILSNGIKKEMPVKDILVQMRNAVKSGELYFSGEYEQAMKNVRYMTYNFGFWYDDEHDLFMQGLRKHGRNWPLIATIMKTRTECQIRDHAQNFSLEEWELRTKERHEQRDHREEHKVSIKEKAERKALEQARVQVEKDQAERKAARVQARLQAERKAEKAKSEVMTVMNALVLNVVKVVEDGQLPTSIWSAEEQASERNRVNAQATRDRKKQTNQVNEAFVNVLRNEQFILLRLARAANKTSQDDDASTEVEEFMKRGSLEDIPSIDRHISESEIGIPLPEKGSPLDVQNRINSRRTRRRRSIKTKRVTDMIKQLERENTLLLEYANRLLAKSTTKACYQTTTIGPGSLFLTVEIGKKAGAKITNVQTRSPLRSVVSENDIVISVNGKLVQKREDIAQNCVRRLVILHKDQ